VLLDGKTPFQRDSVKYVKWLCRGTILQGGYEKSKLHKILHKRLSQISSGYADVERLQIRTGTGRTTKRASRTEQTGCEITNVTVEL
jgi:hypothetical protein